MKKELLKVLSHEMITRSETRNILIGIANREYPDTQVAALLATLALRGTTVDELLGFRDGMMETGNRVTLNNLRFIDIVGTGGDCKNTFNISTASCFVVAGAGYKVAKHGNYSATSVSGASNVMENHGITFTADNELLQRSIDQSGVAYLHARLLANWPSPLCSTCWAPSAIRPHLPARCWAWPRWTRCACTAKCTANSK